jgi:hypothetical protein
VICTTLNKIDPKSLCFGSWQKLLAGLGKTEPDDDPLPLATILVICGLTDALIATESVPERIKDWRLFAVWCGRDALALTKDLRHNEFDNYVLQVCERYAHGMASKEMVESVIKNGNYVYWFGHVTKACVVTAYEQYEYNCAAFAAIYAADAAAQAVDPNYSPYRKNVGPTLAAYEAARARQAKRFLEVVT